ncbi:MAG: hypothetical protein A2857_05330 [Candidatus Levybacteria bacterium RIFCSPHIGHO2_01_FULL_36_15]|nr:MAG: hypothetical protein A2857_05330 [Candidatus Levybacteria bacterium RIFCSPHIGHO2_01_FULL_36_15]OGH38478.1 MAG: hypothetical protein A2905_01585 [Candidatus Levybacteria bacterium RIFCSPLOWO2_01_FULL_36_10]
MLKKVKLHWFGISAILIVLLAFVLRFYNYQNRFGLAYDQAHDALIARHALSSGKLPLLGPFSSAGPFQTGGQWYWFIMLGTVFYPYSVISPWVFLTLLYVLFVYLMIKLGAELIDKKFGIIVGILTAVSSAQITQGTNLTNQSPISLLSLAAIWSGVRYIREKKAKYIFLLGFFASMAASIHLQGVALFFIVLLTLLILRYFRLKHIILLVCGIVLPLLPIIISDFGHNFFNIKNMLYYYLHDQYRISLDVLGRRWSTYIMSFWPQQWAHIIGGQKIIGLFLMLGVAIVLGLKIIKKSISKEWILITAGFASMLILLRYTRSVLFESYLVFTHPVVLLLSAVVIFELFKRSSLIALLSIAIIVLASLSKDFTEIKNATNYTSYYADSNSKFLLQKYPGKKFAIYDYKYKSTVRSLPLALYLEAAGAIDDKGMAIGVGPKDLLEGHEAVLNNEDTYKIVNLGSYGIKGSLNKDWYFANPSFIYHATEEWF